MDRSQGSSRRGRECDHHVGGITLQQQTSADFHDFPNHSDRAASSIGTLSPATPVKALLANIPTTSACFFLTGTSPLLCSFVKTQLLTVNSRRFRFASLRHKPASRSQTRRFLKTFLFVRCVARPSAHDSASSQRFEPTASLACAFFFRFGFCSTRLRLLAVRKCSTGDNLRLNGTPTNQCQRLAAPRPGHEQHQGGCPWPPAQEITVLESFKSCKGSDCSATNARAAIGEHSQAAAYPDLRGGLTEAATVCPWPR